MQGEVDPKAESPAPPGVNPYAPPAAASDAPQATGLRPLTIAYGVTSAIVFGLALTTQNVEAASHLRSLWYVALVAGLGRFFSAMAWLYTSWDEAPREDASAAGPASAAGALARLLIPVYSLYWMFAGLRVLATRLNVRLIRGGREGRLSPAFGYFGVLTWCAEIGLRKTPGLLPYLGVVETGFFLVYMVGVDRAVRELSAMGESVETRA